MHMGVSRQPVTHILHQGLFKVRCSSDHVLSGAVRKRGPRAASLVVGAALTRRRSFKSICWTCLCLTPFLCVPTVSLPLVENPCQAYECLF